MSTPDLQAVPRSPLSVWAETHIKAMFQASTQETFDAAFEAFFAKHTDLTINGKKVARAQYKEDIWNEKSSRSKFSVTFKFPGTVEVPNGTASNNSDVGIVAVYLNATVQFTDPVSSLIINASYQLTIIEDSSLPYSSGPGRQRVSVFDSIASQKYSPIG